MDSNTRNVIIGFQRNEITEHGIYKKLSRMAKGSRNAGTLEKIADEELRHYNIWKKYSGVEVKPSARRYWFYVVISMLFGVTFAVKLMEKGEGDAQIAYSGLIADVPEAEEIRNEENQHENQLIDMIEEEKLSYMGSMVLGLNDALVEFTGALAGFTLALQNSRLIGMTGLIMGFSASLSMAASEYLSTKTEETGRDAVKASFYTGVAYIIAVVVLISPFFIFSNYYSALFSTVLLAVILILIFTFYFSTVKDLPFRKRFLEMLAISMGVAAVSFVIGLLVRKVLHVDI